MQTTVTAAGKTYETDSLGFLQDPRCWDEDFAEAVAPTLGIADGLTQDHWRVLRSIRELYSQTGRCPVVYQVCRANNLTLGRLRELFPTGYQRGACRLAGLSFREGYMEHHWPGRREAAPADAGRIYRVDVRGFLVDPSEWDEDFAVHRAQDMGIPGGLTERHWRIIRWLREQHDRSGEIPTLYQVCDGNGIGLDELETLFPPGYHRGAVKLAGLRMA